MNLRACLLAVCLSTSLVAASSTRGDELRAAYDADTATYRKQLDELAATCRAQKLDALAERSDSPEQARAAAELLRREVTNFLGELRS